MKSSFFVIDFLRRFLTEKYYIPNSDVPSKILDEESWRRGYNFNWNFFYLKIWQHPILRIVILCSFLFFLVFFSLWISRRSHHQLIDSAKSFRLSQPVSSDMAPLISSHPSHTLLFQRNEMCENVANIFHKKLIKSNSISGSNTGWGWGFGWGQFFSGAPTTTETEATTTTRKQQLDATIPSTTFCGTTLPHLLIYSRIAVIKIHGKWSLVINPAIKHASAYKDTVYQNAMLCSEAPFLIGYRSRSIELEIHDGIQQRSVMLYDSEAYCAQTIIEILDGKWFCDITPDNGVHLTRNSTIFTNIQQHQHKSSAAHLSFVPVDWSSIDQNSDIRVDL